MLFLDTSLVRRAAEIAALKEAVRHGKNQENVDKIGGKDWVFLNGKAAIDRWAAHFKNPDAAKGIGDSYCIDIYSSCHAQAGGFLRSIADNYAGATDSLLEATMYFDKEAECLKNLVTLLTWSAPEKDAERNAKAASLLAEAAERYGEGISALEKALETIK